jgi:hypothetical protein
VERLKVVTTKKESFMTLAHLAFFGLLDPGILSALIPADVMPVSHGSTLLLSSDLPAKKA